MIEKPLLAGSGHYFPVKSIAVPQKPNDLGS